MTRNWAWKRAQAARLTLEGKSPSHVATALGVRYTTVAKWMQDKAFQAEIAALTQHLMVQVDMQRMRASFAHFQLQVLHMERNPAEEMVYEQLEEVALELKKKDFLPKIPHETHMSSTMVGLDLTDLLSISTK